MARKSAACALLMVLMLPVFAEASDGAGVAATPVPGTAFERRELQDSLGRTVNYYISKPKQALAPILLMIQGSGCAPIMNIQGTSAYSTMFNLLPFGQEGNFTVIAVEKPFAGSKPGRNSGNPGTAESCTPEFNADFTAERWLVALQATLKDARRLAWVDKKRTLVLGVSEGASMAALLAARDNQVTDVVSIGGSGTTQLFDFIALAYRRCTDVSTCLSDVDMRVREIASDPESSTRFAWGHPFKRWTSFFRLDPAEELARSKARIYLAFGTADESVPALSQEVAVAKLTALGRDLTVRRVPNASHALMKLDAPNMSDLDKELRAALSWFEQAPR